MYCLLRASFRRSALVWTPPSPVTSAKSSASSAPMTAASFTFTAAWYLTSSAATSCSSPCSGCGARVGASSPTLPTTNADMDRSHDDRNDHLGLGVEIQDISGVRARHRVGAVLAPDPTSPGPRHSGTGAPARHPLASRRLQRLTIPVPRLLCLGHHGDSNEQ